MRTADEIRERLRTYTQALYFSHAHREELTGEALARHRALEENIGLLQWCLEPADPARLTWGAAGRALKAALGLFAQKAISRFGRGSRRADPTEAANE